MKLEEKLKVLIIYKDADIVPLKEKICEKFLLESTDVRTAHEDCAAQFTFSVRPFDLIIITPEVSEDIEIHKAKYTKVQDLRGLTMKNFLTNLKMG